MECNKWLWPLPLDLIPTKYMISTSPPERKHYGGGIAFWNFKTLTPTTHLLMNSRQRYYYYVVLFSWRPLHLYPLLFYLRMSWTPTRLISHLYSSFYVTGSTFLHLSSNWKACGHQPGRTTVMSSIFMYLTASL